MCYNIEHLHVHNIWCITTHTTTVHNAGDPDSMFNTFMRMHVEGLQQQRLQEQRAALQHSMQQQQQQQERQDQRMMDDADDDTHTDAAARRAAETLRELQLAHAELARATRRAVEETHAVGASLMLAPHAAAADLAVPAPAAAAASLPPGSFTTAESAVPLAGRHPGS